MSQEGGEEGVLLRRTATDSDRGKKKVVMDWSENNTVTVQVNIFRTVNFVQIHCKLRT